MTNVHVNRTLRRVTVCLAIVGLAIVSDIAAAEQNKPDEIEFYVKLDTWQETMLATRRAVSSVVAQQDSAQDCVELSDWYSTGALWAPDFSVALFAEKSVDIDSKDTAGKLLWCKRSEYVDGTVHRLSNRSPASTYLHRTITAKKTVSFEAGFGSNDGMEIWLNGRKLLSNNVGRTAAPNQEKVRLDFVKGPNGLLLKIFNRSSGSGFYFSLQHDPCEALWRRIQKDFPDQVSLMNNDIGGGRGSVWFHDFDRTELEERMVESVLASLGPAGEGIRKELHQLQLTKASADDRLWLDLYLKACRFREKMQCLKLISFEAMRSNINDMKSAPGQSYEMAADYLNRIDWYEKRLLEIQSALANDDESAWAQLGEFVDRVGPFQRKVQQDLALAPSSARSCWTIRSSNLTRSFLQSVFRAATATCRTNTTAGGRVRAAAFISCGISRAVHRLLSA